MLLLRSTTTLATTDLLLASSGLILILTTAKGLPLLLAEDLDKLGTSRKVQEVSTKDLQWATVVLLQATSRKIITDLLAMPGLAHLEPLALEDSKMVMSNSQSDLDSTLEIDLSAWTECEKRLFKNQSKGMLE